MEYKVLNNGVNMPVIGFGVYQIDDLKETDRVEMAGKCACYLQGEIQL